MSAPATEQLAARFTAGDLTVFTPAEARRFLRTPPGPPSADVGPDPRRLTRTVQWDLLYRLEPELYERLIAGEELHPQVLEALPPHIGRAVEVGAGTGRLTLELAPRCSRLLAVEPARPLATRLRRSLAARNMSHVTVVPGFFDSLPVPAGWADVVIAYSAFEIDPGHGGLPGLREMDRILAPGGVAVLVSAEDPEWLARQGFHLVDLPEAPPVRFGSAAEAAELARIFYPGAAEEIARRNLSSVPRRLIHPGRQRLATRRKL